MTDPEAPRPRGRSVRSDVLALLRALRERRLLQNITSNYLGFAIHTVVAVLLTPFLVHRLGDTQFGIWILVNTLVGHFQLLELGLMLSIVRYVAFHSARGETRTVESIVGSALAFLGVVSVVTVPVALALSWLGPSLFTLGAADTGMFGQAILLTGLITVVGYFRRLFYAVIQGYQRFALLNVCSVTGALFGAGASVVAVTRGHGVTALLLILFVRTAFELALELGFVFWKLGLHPSPRVATRAQIRTLASYSSYAFLMNAALKVTYGSDTYVLGIYAPVSNITPYSIGNQVSSALDSVAEPMVSLLFPLASELDASQSRESLRRLMLRGSQITLLLTAPGAMFVAWHGAQIITWWLGESYVATCLPFLHAFLAVSVCGAFADVPGQILLGIGRIRFVAFVSVAKAVLKVGLALTLVRFYGVIGVVLATLLSTLSLTTLLTVSYACRAIGSRLLGWYARVAAPAVSVCVAAAACFALTSGTAAEPIPRVAADAASTSILIGLALLWTLRDQKPSPPPRERAG